MRPARWSDPHIVQTSPSEMMLGTTKPQVFRCEGLLDVPSRRTDHVWFSRLLSHTIGYCCALLYSANRSYMLLDSLLLLLVEAVVIEVHLERRDQESVTQTLGVFLREVGMVKCRDKHTIIYTNRSVVLVLFSNSRRNCTIYKCTRFLELLFPCMQRRVPHRRPPSV